MTIGLLGRKVGMTQIFAPDGTSVPVTVVSVEPNTVTKLRTPDQDGYTAVQLGIEAGKRRLNKPDQGQYGICLRGLPGWGEQGESSD